jgi:hypothetical protein
MCEYCTVRISCHLSILVFCLIISDDNDKRETDWQKKCAFFLCEKCLQCNVIVISSLLNVFCNVVASIILLFCLDLFYKKLIATATTKYKNRARVTEMTNTRIIGTLKYILSLLIEHILYLYSFLIAAY